MEKNATKVVEITHNIEKLSLELCQRTKTLNDYAIPEADHNSNFAWLKKNQTTLKELLNSGKNITQQMENLFKSIKKQDNFTDLFNVKTKNELAQKVSQSGSSSLENKKTMGKAASNLMAGQNSTENAKALKNSSANELKEFENELAKFLSTKSGKKIKDRIDKLNENAEKINISQCPEKLTQALSKTSKIFKTRQERIKKLTALYKNIQSGFDENIRDAENLDQVYEKNAYLVDLSKAYIKRATDAATKGAFCTVLAENIMEKVFIPDVTGQKINTAQSILTSRSLKVTKDKLAPPESQKEAGLVKIQVPITQKRVKKGTMITLSYIPERLDKASQLANTDCRQWPGSQPVWDTQNNKPGCGCTGDMV